MTLAFTGNMRGSIPTLPKNPQTIFLGNGNFPMTVPARRMDQVRKDRVEDIAIRLRQSIVKLREYEQLQIATTIHNEGSRRGVYVQYHLKGGTYHYITSWARGNMYDLDFKVAAKDTKRETNSTETAATMEAETTVKEGETEILPGQVLHVDGTSGLTNVPKRGWCVIFGKDDRGNEAGYWAEFTAPLFAWPAVQKEVESWWL